MERREAPGAGEAPFGEPGEGPPGTLARRSRPRWWRGRRLGAPFVRRGGL